ncbi:MAG: AEC family transporter [Planctomycetes bacterium]|nr:AEC family transporter [Planctomycetota bacterium]
MNVIDSEFQIFLVSITIVFLGLHKMVSPVVLDAIVTPIEMLGSATPPVSMFVLAAMLATATWDFRAYWKDAYRILIVKFIFLPLLMVGVLYGLKIHDNCLLFAAMLVMQAASAPATGLMMQVKHYGGDVKKISSIVLLYYLVCIPAMSFWLALWNTLSA